MKKLVKMTLLTGAIALALTGCDNKAELKTDTQKEAYAMGASFADYIKSTITAQKITVDDDYVIKGFAETFQGKSQLTKEEVEKTLDALGQRLQAEQKARQEKEAKESLAAGEKFRAEYAAKEGVKKTASGLLYRIIKEGTGKHPTANDTVIAHYTGKLVNGQVFDSSYERGQPATFPLNAVIKGWAEGIQLIGTGGKIELVLPPELAYGEQSLPGTEDKVGVPAQSTLVFEVELVGIQGDKAPQAQDTAPAKK